jgi:hypothetical protein
VRSRTPSASRSWKCCGNRLLNKLACVGTIACPGPDWDGRLSALAQAGGHQHKRAAEYVFLLERDALRPRDQRIRNSARCPTSLERPALTVSRRRAPAERT